MYRAACNLEEGGVGGLLGKLYRGQILQIQADVPQPRESLATSRDTISQSTALISCMRSDKSVY